MNAPAPTGTDAVGTTAPEPMPEQAREERETAQKELIELRDAVQERIQDVDNRLQRTDLTEQTRTAVESERTALLGFRERLDRSLEEVEGSDASTWASVKDVLHRNRGHHKSGVSYAGETSLEAARQKIAANPEEYLIPLSAASRIESYER